MAKGSVRKKGKKWYYRFYVEDASGNLVQKEFAGTESKSETEKLLRQAMEDYEAKRFVAKADNITLGELLDLWAEEELKTGTLSNGTVDNYLQAVGRIKQHPLAKRKLKTVTSEHLQQFVDLLVFGGKAEDFISKGYSKDYVHSYTAVLQKAFRFAVFPKKLITFNPMQYVVPKPKTEKVDLFAEEDDGNDNSEPLTLEQYKALMDYLEQKNQPAILPIQIAYFTDLRLGEVCGLTWQDINLEEQYLTVRRSVRYNGARHKTEIGPTKRKKVRTVDFCDTLAAILRKAKKEQHKQRFQYGELYQRNYYREVKEKNRVHYELYHLDGTAEIPSDYTEISLVCIRPDGAYESPSTIGIVCRTARDKVPGLEGFHFHALRHTYTTNLLSNGAQPKDVQELLGHSDVSTTMNVYAHATREAKRTSARLLDKVVGQ
ncbi:MAG: tyrosine-type recombinase/integrase [Lachnospiraceae bacterium]|nr:tyrosine-type recombinase/integrase [Lachnospiraceae bacterium]